MQAIAPTASPSSELERAIVRLIDLHWTENKTAMLLSPLGMQIRKNFPNSEHLMPDGLRSFILNHNLATIVTYPNVTAKVGAVPLSVNISEDVQELFVSNRSPRRNIRLAKEFWNAFHAPIWGRRFVVVLQNDPHKFSIKDLQSGEPEEVSYEITPDDLTLNDGLTHLPELVDRKWQKIHSWCKKNSLDIHSFVEDGAIGQLENMSVKRAHLNDLGIFSTLEQRDQARIFIPLDIVAKILKTAR